MGRTMLFKMTSEISEWNEIHWNHYVSTKLSTDNKLQNERIKNMHVKKFQSAFHSKNLTENTIDLFIHGSTDD